MIKFREKKYSLEQREYVFRGYGRGLLLGALTGGGIGAIGGLMDAWSAKRRAKKAMTEGGVDGEQAIEYARRKTRRRGALWGGIGGAIKGALVGGPMGALLGGIGGATTGGLTSHIIASKSARSKVNKMNGGY